MLSFGNKFFGFETFFLARLSCFCNLAIQHLLSRAGCIEFFFFTLANSAPLMGATSFTRCVFFFFSPPFSHIHTLASFSLSGLRCCFLLAFSFPASYLYFPFLFGFVLNMTNERMLPAHSSLEIISVCSVIERAEAFFTSFNPIMPTLKNSFHSPLYNCRE